MWSIPVDFLEDIFPQGMPCDFHVISNPALDPIAISIEVPGQLTLS